MTKPVLLCCSALLSACLTVPNPCRQHRCDKDGDSGSDAAAAVDGGHVPSDVHHAVSDGGRDDLTVDAAARVDAGDDAGNDATVPECTRNQDCLEEVAPRCGSDERCTSCSADSDCERFGKVCDEGQCVQCTGTKTDRCGSETVGAALVHYVCDSKARTCVTGVLPKSADLCSPCVSDAQCGLYVESRCTPTTFAGKPMGNYCLPVAEIGETCSGQHHPWNAPSAEPSVDGVSDPPTCQLEKTTCPALVDAADAKDCGADSTMCGLPGVADGICVQ
ncbi:MAG TPA: hypothetical protein VMF89_32995, partial [Polyangiales bacterium]|nr:hypothetical protein [Polyangiales bacterium]